MLDCEGGVWVMFVCECVRKIKKCREREKKRKRDSE